MYITHKMWYTCVIYMHLIHIYLHTCFTYEMFITWKKNICFTYVYVIHILYIWNTYVLTNICLTCLAKLAVYVLALLAWPPKTSVCCPILRLWGMPSDHPIFFEDFITKSHFHNLNPSPHLFHLWPPMGRPLNSENENGLIRPADLRFKYKICKPYSQYNCEGEIFSIEIDNYI